jgi:hypothetical protein
MARAGSRETFKSAAEDLKAYAEITVTAKDVERIAEGVGEAVLDWQKKEREGLLSKGEDASLQNDGSVPILYVSYDGTGVPMVPWEVAGRKGKQENGSSKTREVKLGCVFTQTDVDEAGFPVRDEESTTYLGAIETSDVFGERIYAEAKRRGLDVAERVVVIADAARYNWEIAGMHFPNAIWIVDLYHARQHLHTLCKALVMEADLARLETRLRTLLDGGKIERILREVHKRLPQGQPIPEVVRKEIGYFKNNQAQMRYADFRAQGLFVGSGVIEAGCKTLVGMRLKQSGMEWTVRGANAIIALRCCSLSHRFEDFWEQRVA